MSQDSIDGLRETLKLFREEREWEQFHSPKNLSIALASEVGELLEHFQWKTSKESFYEDDPVSKKEIAFELADVFLYLIQLSDRLGIDLIEAANSKIKMNNRKYPVGKSRGKSTKYTKL